MKTLLTEVPFSTAFVSLNPHGVRLLDQRVPISRRLELAVSHVTSYDKLLSSFRTELVHNLKGNHIPVQALRRRGVFFVVEKEFLDGQPVRLELTANGKASTNIANTRGRPSASLCEALNSKASQFAVRTTFLPSVDTARSESQALVSV